MLCKAVNKWRGVEFTPEIDPDKPFEVLYACSTHFASDLHTKQVEIVIDREFSDELAKQGIYEDESEGHGPGEIMQYNNVPVLVTG